MMRLATPDLARRAISLLLPILLLTSSASARRPSRRLSTTLEDLDGVDGTGSPGCTAATSARASFPALDLEATAHTFPSKTLYSPCRWPGVKTNIALVHVGKTGGETIEQLLQSAGVNHTWIHAQTVKRDVPDSGPSSPLDYFSPAQAALACEHTHYIVTMREPLNRTVSAFNYETYIAGLSPGPDFNFRTLTMKKMYERCFPGVTTGGSAKTTGTTTGGANAFAEAMGEDTECGALARACIYEPQSADCGHTGRGMAHYVKDTGLLEVLRRDDKHTYAIRTETFDDDVDGLWDWLCVPRPSRPEMIYTHTDDYARKKDTALSASGEARLRSVLSTEYYVKQTIEGLADNAPSRERAAWARPPLETDEGSKGCMQTCGYMPRGSYGPIDAISTAASAEGATDMATDDDDDDDSSSTPSSWWQTDVATTDELLSTDDDDDDDDVDCPEWVLDQPTTRTSASRCSKANEDKWGDDSSSSSGALVPVLILVCCCMCACWPAIRGQMRSSEAGVRESGAETWVESGAQAYDSRPNEAALAASQELIEQGKVIA